MVQRALDIDAVRAFVCVAELGSFTRAAEAMVTTQSAVSLRLKRLEDRIGHRLVVRTPRHVALSAEGARFLEQARSLLEVHDRTLDGLAPAPQRLAIGISDHVAGPELPALIAHMNERDTGLVIEIRIGSSGELLQSFDRRELDTVVVRFHAGRDDGDLIAEEALGWFAGPSWSQRLDRPLPIVTMAEPCGVRILSSRLLDEAGVQWSEAFVGGGVLTVAAAVMAGLGIAAVARRLLPLDAVEIGPALGLPALPRLPVLLHTRVRDARSRDALNALAEALRKAIAIAS